MSRKASTRGRVFITLDVAETVIVHSSMKLLRRMSRHLPNRDPELVALQDGLEQRLLKRLESLGVEIE